MTPDISRRAISLAMFAGVSGALLSRANPSQAAGILAGTLVRTPAELEKAIAKARPGDTIVMANGSWKDTQIVFAGQGLPGTPITLAAQTAGQVLMNGKSNLRIIGEHLVVSGLVFRDGYSPDSEVISFAGGKKSAPSNHCRVTECTIINFNEPDKKSDGGWVNLHGRHNRVDHCHFEGKTNKGVTVAVRFELPNSDENHHSIDHNFFGPRAPFNANGAESIRIGTGAFSTQTSATLVENNLFEGCSGELEIISLKTWGNIIRGNIFLRSAGTVTFRQGRFNLVEGNLFVGSSEADAGGVRIINTDQTVRNNVFVSLRGTDMHSGLSFMNGVPNRTVASYGPVMRGLVENNTFYDVSAFTFGLHADGERSQAPRDSLFRNNLLINCAPSAFIVKSSVEGITFSGNLSNGPALPEKNFGLTVKAMEAPTQFDAWGMPMLKPEFGVGSSMTKAPFERKDVGPSYGH